MGSSVMEIRKLISSVELSLSAWMANSSQMHIYSNRLLLLYTFICLKCKCQDRIVKVIEICKSDNGNMHYNK